MDINAWDYFLDESEMKAITDCKSFNLRGKNMINMKSMNETVKNCAERSYYRFVPAGLRNIIGMGCKNDCQVPFSHLAREKLVLFHGDF